MTGNNPAVQSSHRLHDQAVLGFGNIAINLRNAHLVEVRAALHGLLLQCLRRLESYGRK